MDSVRKGEHEFRHSSGFIIHYKLLPGDAVVAATLCGIEDNPFSCRGVLQRLEMVVGAFCKDGDISERSAPPSAVALAIRCVVLTGLVVVQFD